MLRDARRTLAHLIRQSARSCNSGVAAGEIPERRRQVWRGVSQRGRRRRPGKLHSHVASSVPNRRVVAQVLRYRARRGNWPPNGTTFGTSLGGTCCPEAREFLAPLV